MARPPRIEFENAIYHITARGNNKQGIFLDDEDRGFFINCLTRCWKRFDLEILAFCLMSNHFHLFLRTPRANLSKAMQWINGTYTGHFNWRHKRSGHLLQGRYKSVLIADDTHYMHLSMYIHLNPVRAGLVEDPSEYFWSSYRDYTSRRSRFAWLNPDEILSQYGDTRPVQTRRYMHECLSLIGQRLPFVEEMKKAPILGSREMVEKLMEQFYPSGKIQGVAKRQKPDSINFDLPKEMERVAKILKIDVHGLKQKRRNFPGRMALYYHLVENCGFSTLQVARQLNITQPAVSIGIKRLREMLLENKKLVAQIKQLTYMLRPDPKASTMKLKPK